MHWPYVTLCKVTSFSQWMIVPSQYAIYHSLIVGEVFLTAPTIMLVEECPHYSTAIKCISLFFLIFWQWYFWYYQFLIGAGSKCGAAGSNCRFLLLLYLFKASASFGPTWNDSVTWFSSWYLGIKRLLTNCVEEIFKTKLNDWGQKLHPKT